MFRHEAALPAAPLPLAASTLPVTLPLLGLLKRRTTRNKRCLPSLGSTCTVTLTSLCMGSGGDTQSEWVSGFIHHASMAVLHMGGGLRRTDPVNDRNSERKSSRSSGTKASHEQDEGAAFTYSRSTSERQPRPALRSALAHAPSGSAEG